MIRVLLADDQALIRSAFAMMLSVEDDIDVVGHAANGDEAVRLAEALVPDVILMDVRMPVMDGIEATRRISAIGTARVLVLTTFDSDEYLFDALAAGAAGFLLKNSAPEELIAGIRHVAKGHSLLAPEVTKRVIEARTRAPQTYPGIDLLTDREREVLVSLAIGRSNAEIASALFVSETTVKTHVSNVLAKLGARNRVQAVIAAYESGLVRPG